MKKTADNMEQILQDRLFPNAQPLKRSERNDVSVLLQDALFARKARDKEKRYRQKMPRLIDDMRRQLLMRLAAIAVVVGSAGYYGVHKGIPYATKKIDEGRHARFTKSVAEGHDEAEALYASRNTKVKMVDYELGESQKIGEGLFAEYKSPLIMDYDTTGDGRANMRVYHKVDTELFLGWGEGDVADEVHGSWRHYSHPLNDVLKATREAKGSILNLDTGKMVKFGRGSR